MHFSTLMVLIAALSTIYAQRCVDEIKSQYCHQIYCRFFPRIRNQCRKSCGDCKPIDPTCGPGQIFRYKSKTACCTPRPSDQCGVQEEASARVIGGGPAMQNQWPWMVRLEIGTGQTLNLCGGVLLTQEWVVTAAHCVVNFNPNQISAFVGYSTFRQAKLGVSSVTAHPNFQTAANDIALLKLQRSVSLNEYVQKLCLPRGEVAADNKKCFIAGWGVTDIQNPAPAAVLQEAQVDIIPFRFCKEAYKSNSFASKLSNDLQICAGSLSGEVDSCIGDSGGPIMCQRCSSCSWYMAGIVSIGPVACGTPLQPGLYTNVTTFEPWIEGIIGQTQRQRFSC